MSNIDKGIQLENGAMFTCTKYGDHYSASHAAPLPDGDHVDLFCKFVDDMIVVTDRTETAR